MTKAKFQLLLINQVGLNLQYEQHQKRSLVQPGKLTERSLSSVLKPSMEVYYA
ncbi:MAG: hypothetical protein V7L21_33215 [Nostoc sp.]|uniref:hypothetical protein n=1 Tax=Nostoc sp. TaxID=1180 RepID=UPI002FFBFA25|nr:hypothetical protein [Nostoc sp. NMS9]